MEKIRVESEDGSRRPAELPWEQVSMFHYDDQGFGRKPPSGRAAIMVGQRQGRPPSRNDAEEKSGLTRRGMVYEYIRAHPGAHVRRVAKELGLATGDFHYHLQWLEKHGYVETRKNGFYRFVFPARMFEERQEVVLGILSQETPRDILLSLLQGAGTTQGDLAKSLGHSQPTISWHLERLIRKGVVSRRKTNKGIAYAVEADQGEILRFVKEYHPGVWRRWASRLPGMMLTARDGNAERVKIKRVGLMRPALVELIGRS
ncbi:MAG: winged helix-turn-helix transcriptional regulator [Thaumarchaeota archaeon]|nr:winged helix-turn-helix transcriptional regulator [Nitrososphaerota archaeon]